MLLCDNVVDLMKSRRKSLWKPAILAAVACPAPHCNLKAVDHTRASTSSSAFIKNSPGLGVQDVEQTSELLKSTDLQLLRRSETARSGLCGQLPHAVMIAGREADLQKSSGSRGRKILVKLNDPFPNPRAGVGRR